MLNRVLLPSSYFGPIEYYAFLSKCNNVYIEVQENFVKQTIRNRCYIMSANGKLRLTVPVKKTKQTKIKNIRNLLQTKLDKKSLALNKIVLRLLTLFFIL